MTNVEEDWRNNKLIDSGLRLGKNITTRTCEIQFLNSFRGQTEAFNISMSDNKKEASIHYLESE